MHFSTVAAAFVAGLSLTHASPIEKRDIPIGLNTVAKAVGKLYFGSATDNLVEWNDTKYLSIFDEYYQFGQTVPTNAMKWEYTEPERNVFNYSGGDQLIERGLFRDGKLIRCHNLVWYNQLPEWLTSGTWTNATLISIMENHITNLVEHWAPYCYAWDVVNEAFNDDGTYREDLFYNTIGPAYIPIAYKAAQAAIQRTNPNIKLYYNDYNIEYPGVKATSAQNLVKSLKSQNIRIDGVGLQSHFIVGETPSSASQLSNMESFTALDVDVAITELDIRFSTLPYNTTGEIQQATDYEGTVSACRQVSRCVGITLWDYTDKYSWIPSTFPGQGGACPWDENINVKPIVYAGIVKGLTIG